MPLPERLEDSSKNLEVQNAQAGEKASVAEIKLPVPAVSDSQAVQEVNKSKLPSDTSSTGELDIGLGDYFTWLLIFIGWAIAWKIAKWQTKKNAEVSDNERLNQLIDQIQENIATFENKSIEFWISPSTDFDQVELDRFARDLKRLTLKAREIEIRSGPVYPKALCKDLRQSVTKVSTQDEAFKPVPYSDFRVTQIRATSRKLRLHYKL